MFIELYVLGKVGLLKGEHHQCLHRGMLAFKVGPTQFSIQTKGDKVR